MLLSECVFDVFLLLCQKNAIMESGDWFLNPSPELFSQL